MTGSEGGHGDLMVHAPGRSVPSVARFDGGESLLSAALLRIADAIRVLESWPEDDEARQEALLILTGGAS